MSNQLVLHSQRKPDLYQIIHYQVEEGGKYESTLSIPHICFEVQVMLTILTGNVILLVPKNFQELAHMRAGAVSFQVRQ